MKINDKLRSITALILIAVIIFSIGNVTAVQWDVGDGKTYTTIQEAIDNANTKDGDVLNVFNGIYSEDVIINKNLTLKVNNGDYVVIKPTTTGFTVINNGMGNGSGTTIAGFHINLTPAGLGINVSADNCLIKYNTIIGGNTGINITGSNTTVIKNKLSGQSGNGILGNLTGGFFTVSGNKISNIKGTGPANGISITVSGNVTEFNALKNIISNIEAGWANGSATGIQLGKSKGADGNPEMANVQKLFVLDNIIMGIASYSPYSPIIGIELITNSIKTSISNNAISKLTGYSNNTIFALEAAIMGNGTVLIQNNRIDKLKTENQAVGIVAIAIGDLKLKYNQVSGLSKANSAVGMLGLGLLKNAFFYKNKVFDINSPNTAAGIVGTALGNMEMLYNTVFKVKGANDVALVGAGFNKTQITGNNLDGDGSGIGVVICSLNGTINFNRIAGFDYYIQNFKFASFGPDIDELLKPIDDAIKNHPELEPILKPIKDDLDRLFHELEESNTRAKYNWYGANNPQKDKFFKASGTLIYDPWLVMKIQAHPSTIKNGQTSTITADVYTDSAGVDHSADASLFFSGPGVTFTTNLGNLGNKMVTAEWINGQATAVLKANEGPGTAKVTAVDYQSVWTTINIMGAPDPSLSKAGANAQIIGMQHTGIPLVALIFALFIVVSGLIIKRR